MLHNLTITKFHEGLTRGEFTALHVVEEYFKMIEARDPEIGAYLALFKDGAYEDAEQVDLAMARGEKLGPLAGVPMAIKDNMLIAGQPATAASKILEHYTASYDATVIKKLREAGAVFLGKTNLDEFAMGSSTENSAFKKTKNPHDRERVPGGSSGGSAAAVAGHMALAALGSDTGGSIRQPAAFCGVVGLKPTYGAVSRHGLIAMASSLDQIGPIARTAEDAGNIFFTIAGRDPFDATSADVQYPERFTELPLETLRELVVGVPKEYFTPTPGSQVGGFIEGLAPEVQKSMDETLGALKSLKLKVKEISLPHTKYALSVYYIIMPAEVSANLARYDGIRYARTADQRGTETRLPAGRQGSTRNLLELYKTQRSGGFGPETKRRIILGTFVLSSGYYDAYYTKAQKVRRLITEDFEKAFDKKAGDGVDVIFAPVTPTPAFKFGEKTDDPLQMYLSDIFTIPANLAGLPAVSIPVRQATGDTRQGIGKTTALSQVALPMSLPVGFQLIGRRWREEDILQMGHWYERAMASTNNE